MILAGLDEAALGPSLGPFCACLTHFRIPEIRKQHLRDLYSALTPSVVLRPGESGIAVADSKALYSSGRCIASLEDGVTAFLLCAGFDLPMDFATLVETLAGEEDRRNLERAPWFAAASGFPVPWPASITGSDRTVFRSRLSALRRTLEENDTLVMPPRLRIVTAAAFNRAIDAAGGKGGAVRALISPLLDAALKNDPEEPGHITVDRQGGRRYYGEWLLEIAPGSALRATEESPTRSAYTLGARSVEFLVKADALRMETALASMFAKYVRETSMRLFNDWWISRLPGLAPTAGYPADAKRFIAALESAGILPDNRDELIRKL